MFGKTEKQKHLTSKKIADMLKPLHEWMQYSKQKYRNANIHAL